MFKDFAAYTNTDGVMPPDPADSYVRLGSSLTSGHMGAGWTRPYISFVPSRDAGYLSVAARVLSPAQASLGLEHLVAQYFTQWQLERAQTSGTPRAFSPAREIQVVVKADRINLVSNPSFEVSDAGWAVTNAAFVRDNSVPAKFGSWVCRVTTTATTTTSLYSATPSSYQIPVREGLVYAAQAYSRAGSVGRSITMAIRWYTAAGVQISETAATPVANAVGEWKQYSVVGTAPEDAEYARLFFTITGTAAGEVHYFDGFFMEQAEQVGEYFDGSYGDDYLWETGPGALAPGNSRSYYYESRLNRSEALLRALRDTVPVGIGIGVPQFAVFTG